MKRLVKKNYWLIGIIVWISACVCVCAAPGEQRISILTTPDLHGQLEEYSCVTKKGKEKETKMIGGMARIADAVSRIRQENPGAVVLVSSGDDLGGKYFRVLRGKEMYALMNRIGYDVVTLGNHEFDHGIKTLKEAADTAKFPIVVSNMSFEGTTLFKNIKKYYVKEIAGIKIGFIGLMTPAVRQITKVEDPVTVNARIVSVADEYVGYLRDIERVDLVVALTHIGHDLDKELAQKVRGIDVICGGHSHTLLPAGKEVVIERADGGKTIIVQSGDRGGFLGRLDLTLRDGKIIAHDWRTIMLDASVAADPAVQRMIERFKKKLPKKIRIGESLCDLDARRETVRAAESNVGNMITDAIRERFGVDIACINGGGIRGETLYAKGALYADTIIEMFPFENDVVICKMTGKELRRMLELSVSEYEKGHGRFLQVAGLRYAFDPAARPLVLKKDEKGDAVGIAEEGERVREISCLGRDGTYQPCRDDALYSVAVGSYMAGGGDGYFMLKGTSELHTYVTVQSVIEDYIRAKKQIAPKTEGRITVLGKDPAAAGR